MIRKLLFATAAFVALGGQAQATCVGTGLIVSPDPGCWHALHDHGGRNRNDFCFRSSRTPAIRI